MAIAHTQPGGDIHHGRRVLVLWLAISAIVTPIAVFVVGPLIPPGNGSVQAEGQVFDNQVLIGVSAPIIVFVLVMLGYTLIVFHQRDAVLEGPPVRGDSRLQLWWIVITSVTVLGLAAFGTYELVKDGAGGGQGPSATFLPSNHNQAMDVQVIGQQWEFTYRYPTYGGLETPHLYLPADTLIRLHVTSLDVVHSFWAVNLGVKADANPGTDNVVYVQTKHPLALNIRCSELCGLWHGYMFDGQGRVVSQSEFASWIKQQQALYGPVLKYLPPYSTTYSPEPQLRAG
ncbi:MAG TPA: cytochrome c oxidase subunit II [Gaiellaceae bacterium]|nr:cytochrome c oxidase subunit II [Gaiellaceae bacterium]